MTALVGLLGVIVGGFVTAGVTLFLEWRRDRIAARAGARMLQDDLTDAVEQIREALTTGARWPGALPLRTTRWNTDFQPLMARQLRRHEWHAVSAGFDFLDGINQFDAVFRAKHRNSRVDLDEQGVKQLKMAMAGAVTALAHLDRLARWSRWGRSKPTAEQMILTRLQQDILIQEGVVTEHDLIESGERLARDQYARWLGKNRIADPNP